VHDVVEDRVGKPVQSEAHVFVEGRGFFRDNVLSNLGEQRNGSKRRGGESQLTEREPGW